MNKKVLGILVFMLLIASGFGSLYGGAIESGKKIDDNNSKFKENFLKLNNDIDWLMFHHDSQNSGYSPSAAQNTNNVEWMYTTGDDLDSSPAVVNGNLYIGSNDNNVYCIDAYTGEKIWSYDTQHLRGSSPAFYNGKIYIGAYIRLYCLNSINGNKIWEYQIEGGTVGSPSVLNGKVYFGSNNNNVYCVDAEDGHKIWSYTTGSPVVTTPAVVNGKVYFGSNDHNVYCLDAEDGHKIWNYPTGENVDRSSPAVVDGWVYVGSNDANVYCLDANNGNLKWISRPGGSIVTTPAVAYNKVYIGSYGFDSLYCLDANNGNIEWSYDPGDYVESSPAVADGRVYFGSSNNKLCCLDAYDGSFIWSYSTGNSIFSSPAIYDGRIYVGSSDNKIYCFGPGGENQPPNPPSRPLGPSSIGVDESGSFSTSATDPDGNNIRYRFNWGNGEISDWTGLVSSGDLVSISHSWSSAGTYELKAQAQDGHGYNSAWSDPLTVKVVSVSAHGPYKGLTNYYVQFEGSVSSGTPPYTWHWDFGDGGTSNQQNPQHTYTSSGSYTARLTLVDGHGISHSDSASVQIKDIPSWVDAAIILADATPSWDGNHFHTTVPFKNFQQLLGIDGSVPGDVNIKDFSGPYDFNFDWDNTYLKVDLYPYKPNQDKITLSGSAGVDIDAYKNLKLSTGVRANFEKIGDEFTWELCFNINGRYEFPVLRIYSAIGPVPVSAEAKLHFDAGAEFCLNSPDEFHNHVFGSVSGSLGVGATVRGGIGVVGAASVGLYTDVGGSWNFRAPEQDNSLYSSFSVYLSFGAYAELIFVFDWEWEWFHASWPSYQMENMATENFDDGWGVMPRSYDEPSWVNNNDGLLLNNAFPMSHPSISRNSNSDKMMVWAQDDLSKPAGGDGLDLWSSTWDKNSDKWKTPQRITDDSLAQSNPNIAILDNGDAICVFNCLTEPIGDRSVIDAASDSEIGYCYYNGESWSEPQLIGVTSGHFMDSYPVIASDGDKAVVVWMCDDNPAGITVNDRLLYASFWDGNGWSIPSIIVEDNIISLPVSISYNGNEAACAYAIDENGVIENPEDEAQNIYIKTFTPYGYLMIMGDPIKITDGGINAHPDVNFINSGSPAVTWMNENPDDKSVTILYQGGIGTLSNSFDSEVVFDGLDQGSSTSLFKSGYGSLTNNGPIPVVAWSDGKNLCYKRRFGSGSWEDLNILHMTDEEITQIAWDYDGFGDEIHAVYLEKDKVNDVQGCQMFEAGKKDMLSPVKPYKPLGPGNGYIGQTYEFETSSNDPTPMKQLRYGWDWDDGSPIEWTDWVDSGIICKMSHSWDETGEYNIRVKADNGFKESEWSEPLKIIIGEQNFPPVKPVINGPTSGKTGAKYDYTFVSTDPEEENIQYYVEWGDGDNSGWTEASASGESITLSHIWSAEKSYTVKAKAKDTNDQESDLTTYSVSIPKSKDNSQFIKLLPRLFNLFPILQKILLFLQHLISH